MLNNDMRVFLSSMLQDYVKNISENIFIKDPFDETGYEGHYGDTFLCATLFQYGISTKEEDLLNQGYVLLDNILNAYEIKTKYGDFHNDFNNFALSYIYELLDNGDNKDFASRYIQRIKDIVIKTPNSNHFTTNWLPMRIYVNDFRYKMTRNKTHLKANNKLVKLINKSINEDYLIEDYPQSKSSYNLQYNIATLALLIFLGDRGYSFPINKCLNAILGIVAINGDINYFGRGSNQIFPWGPWFYICNVFNLNEEKPLDYFMSNKKYVKENKNIFLNNFNPNEKYLWWDYHYSSVYIPYLLFWLSLSNSSIKNRNLFYSKEDIQYKTFTILKRNNCMIVFNQGTKKYRSEHGPQVVLIEHLKLGTLFKSPFGPFGKPFGKLNTNLLNCTYNYFGIIQIKRNKLFEYMKVKLGMTSTKSLHLLPLYILPRLEFLDDEISLVYKLKRKMMFCVNLPIHNDAYKGRISILIDDKLITLKKSGTVATAYGFKDLYQSSIYFSKLITIKIRLS